jgi:putative SOS response-associated peptidase YedK
VCGRYAASANPDDLVEEFEVVERPEQALEPSWNVAPTQDVYAVLERAPRGEPDEPPRRRLQVARWGLVPAWAKDAAIGNRMINARMETVAEKPAFKKAFAKRRALLPADGYFEWYPTSQLGKSGKPLKQPFYLHPKDDHPLCLAGIYEFWRDKDKPDGDPDAWLTTFTIITTNATDDVGHIHDRMPMTIAREDWERWLDPRVDDVEEIRGMMAPPPAGSLDIYAITTAVNNVRNNGPELLEPLPLET